MRSSSNIIVVDSSWLVVNLCRSILPMANVVDCTTHIEDIDVLLSERRYDAIILGEGVFSLEKWDKTLARNPKLLNLKKIFISNSKAPAPKGFDGILRPFTADELQKKLGFLPKKVIKKGKTGTRNFSNKRIFERKKIKSRVYFNDELGVPVIKLLARDLSLGGMFVEGGEIDLKKGSLLFISFEEGGRQVNVTGEVVRITEKGFGIRFLGGF